MDYRKVEWLKTFLSLPNGIPSHDTIVRVFALLEPTQLQECFVSWVKSIAELSFGEVVSLDGKSVRRSYDKGAGKGAIHMVSAWTSENQLVLGQVAEFGLFDRVGQQISIDRAEGAITLLLSGEPIDEPIVGQGPFVMNHHQEIRQAMIDYQNGRMGAITVLVYNAGACAFSSIDEADVNAFQRAWEVNARGLFAVAKGGHSSDENSKGVAVLL